MDLQFSSLNQLNDSTTKWKVKVRIIRLWRQCKKLNSHLTGFNLLVLDDQNKRMEVIVPEHMAKAVEEHISLEEVHILFNFQVKEYKRDVTYKCINYDRYILLNEETQIQHITALDESIQQNSFDFYELHETRNLANLDIFLTDVVGLLKVEEQVFNDSQNIVKFHLTDKRTTVNATFDGDLAIMLHEKISEFKNQAIIMIIASAKVSLLKDQVHISNVPATTFYLNYNTEAVIKLRQITEEKLHTIDEIKLMEDSGQQVRANCCLQIHSVERDIKWYIHQCTSCNNEVSYEYDKFHCRSCNRTIHYPAKRFQLHAKAKDATGEIRIQVPHNLIHSLTGLNVTEVQMNREEATEEFPMCLTNLEGTQLKVEILLPRSATDKQSNSYKLGNTWKEEIPTRIQSSTMKGCTYLTL